MVGEGELNRDECHCDRVKEHRIIPLIVEA
jgi:hypothetical protein